MKTLLFIYNPRAGRKAIARNVERVIKVFDSYGFNVVPQPVDFSRPLFDGETNVDLVVVAGGDGTVNFVVNAMKRQGVDLPLGIIPAGTANDFARVLGMSHDVKTAAHQIATGVEERIDCGRVNDLYFVNIFSFGAFTTTSQRTPTQQKNRIGKFAYFIEGIKEFRAIKSVPLRIRVGQDYYDIDSLMVLILNGETAGGIRLSRRSASVTDGKLDVLILEKRNFFHSTFAMWNYLWGGNPKIIHRLKVDSIDIESSVNTPTDIDGQKGAEFPLHIECLKGELRIICPK